MRDIRKNFRLNRYDRENNYFYIRLILCVCCGILMMYTIFNLFFRKNYYYGVACLIVALFVLTDFIYINVYKKQFNSLMLSILGFTGLCIFLLFFSHHDITVGRMWILLCPLITFYTQEIKKTLIYLSICLLAVLIHTIYNWGLGYPSNRLNVEQVYVFILVSLMTYVYARSSRKKVERIDYQLYHNLLTGLPNRKALQEHLLERGYKTIALINIDSFKSVNNLYGNRIGDEVIKIIGNRIFNVIEGIKPYKLFKLHADEYAITVINSIRPTEDLDFLKRLPAKIDGIISIGDIEIYPSFTVGIHHGEESLLEDADMALKRAKKDRKDVVIYNEKMNPKLEYKDKHNVINKIMVGLSETTILPAFQPILNIKSNRVESYEALARLSIRDEILQPRDFIELSKEMRLYHLITTQMIDKTFHYVKDRDISISLNLDNDDFEHEKTTSYIINKLVEFQIGPKICFEILETSEIKNPEKVIKFINMVKSLGCKIAVDDFGAGYSSLYNLISFRVDYLKIDASLIKNIDTSEKSQVIVKSIISVAKEMNMKTVAEHVDTEEILQKIRTMGIDYAQGYHVGEPNLL